MTAADPLSVLCPICWAEPGVKRKNYTGAACGPHGQRVREAREEPGHLAPEKAAEYIRQTRQLLDKKQAEMADLEKRLARMLIAAGRRPDDGDDHPALFPAADQPRLR